MKGFLKLIAVCDNISYKISKIGAVVSGILVSLITIMIFMYIINRAFIGGVWLFVEEWTALSLIPIAYLGMGYTLRANRHLYIDVLTRKFSTKRKDLVSAIVSVFSLLVLGFMIERSYDWMMYTIHQQIKSTGPMRTPMWIFSCSMFLGFCMYAVDMFFFTVSDFLKIFGSKLSLQFED